MSHPVAARPLHPVVALIWGVFLFWSVWVGAVWLLRIGSGWIGYSPSDPSELATKLPNDAFWRAVEILAAKAELVWLMLAVACLHLFVSSAHGLQTARAWLAISAGLALAFGAVNSLTGVPFGWMSFGEPLGVKMSDWREADASAPAGFTETVSTESGGQTPPGTRVKQPARKMDYRLLGVPVGWAFLWVVVVIAAREAVLGVSPKLSHRAGVLWAGVLVTLTLLNLEPIAVGLRGWWYWHGKSPLEPIGFRWWTAFGWLACACLTQWLLRERSVLTAATRRSLRPLILLGTVNILALSSHLRNAIQ